MSACLQVENMIHFYQDELLLQWDHQIQSICTKVNSIIDTIEGSKVFQAAA